MAELSFATVDVFTAERYRGNPLGVVLIPPGKSDIPTDTLQTIAREFNLSETVFIYQNDSDDGAGQQGLDSAPQWKIRIFITSAELPFAGHPTIGAAVFAMGTLVSGCSSGRFSCPAGTIDVDWDASSRVAKASIPHDIHIHTEAPVTEEDVFALQPALKGMKKPVSIDTVSPVKGMSFVCVELADLDVLAAVQTTGVKPAPKLDKEWDVGFCGSLWYVRTGVDAVRARMIEGLLEDPATGSAACALGALLALKGKSDRTMPFQVTQGVEMGRKSDIGVAVTLNDRMDGVERIVLSGTAVQIMEGKLRY